jgi:hypothetical protein
MGFGESAKRTEAEIALQLHVQLGALKHTPNKKPRPMEYPFKFCRLEWSIKE